MTSQELDNPEGRPEKISSDKNLFINEYSLDQHTQELEEKLCQVRHQLKQECQKGKERDIDTTNLWEFILRYGNVRRINIESDWENTKALFAGVAKVLEREPSITPNESREAQSGLKKGKTSKAEILLEKLLNQFSLSTSPLKVQAAEVAYLIAKLAQYHFDYSQAVKYYQQAVNLDSENSIYYQPLAEWLITIGKREEAVDYLKKALAINQLSPNSNYAAIILNLSTLGRCYFYLCQNDEALKYFNEAIEFQKQQNKNDDLLIADVWGQIGYVLEGHEKYDEAVQCFETSLNINLETREEKGAEVAKCWKDLGDGWFYKTDYDQAINCYEKALAQNIRIFGEDHPRVACSWRDIGSTWGTKGNFDKELECYEKALNCDLKIFGETHPYLAERWSDLAEVWKIKEDYDKAISMYEKALEILINNFGENYYKVSSIWKEIGRIWFKQGNHDNAIQCFENALKIWENSPGNNQIETAFLWKKLARAWGNKRQFDKALVFYEKVLSTLLIHYGYDHLSVQAVMDELGSTWMKEGNVDQAIKYYEQAVASKINCRPDFEIAPAWRNLGDAYKLKGDKSKAARNYEYALIIFQSKLGKDHRLTLEVKRKLDEARENPNS